MKKIFGFLFLLTYSISAVSQTKATSFPGAGFKAAFPNKPEVVKNDVDSKVGKIATTTYNCEGEDFLIVLSESIYPAELIKKLDGAGVQGILDGAKTVRLRTLKPNWEENLCFLRMKNSYSMRNTPLQNLEVL